MKSLELTGPAQDQLDGIFEYTVNAFGWEQAERYYEQLVTGAKRLCDSPFPLGRSCAILKGDELSIPLVYIRVSMHCPSPANIWAVVLRPNLLTTLSLLYPPTRSRENSFSEV